MSKPTVTIVDAGDIPLEIGAVSTLYKTNRNASPVERSTSYFNVAHMDIANGNIITHVGIKYALIIVDRQTRFTYTLPLKNCKGESIIVTLKHLKYMPDKLPLRFFTDFYTKILCEAVITFLADNNSLLLVAPLDQQHQNGLVERTWHGTILHYRQANAQILLVLYNMPYHKSP